MTRQLAVMDIELSNEDGAELEALIDQENHVAVKAFIEKKTREKAVEKAFEKIQFKVAMDVLRNVHHCMHTDQAARGVRILCVANALLDESDEVTPSVLELLWLADEMTKINTERAKASCEGEG